MSRPPILSGYVPTPVPGPAEIPTPVPGPAIVATEVPGPVVVDTEIPGPVIVPTPVPGPTIVATDMPFWIRQVIALLEAEGEITVQILGVELDASAALRGRGEIPVQILGIETGAPTQYLRGRGRISAVVGMILPAGLKTLAGRGRVLVASAVMALPGGTKILGGRGAITATRTGYKLTPAGTRILAGRGLFTVSGVSQTLNIPAYQMTKTNTTAGSGTSYATLTGMAAAAAYPGSIVDNSAALRIPNGLPSYSATVYVEVPHTGGTAPRYGQSQIYRNGSRVATGAQQTNSPGTSTATWTGTVSAGDYFVIQWRGEGNFFNRPTAQAGSFLRITPN